MPSTMPAVRVAAVSQGAVIPALGELSLRSLPSDRESSNYICDKSYKGKGQEAVILWSGGPGRGHGSGGAALMKELKR